MRKLSACVVLVLAASACAPALSGPAAPIAREQVGAGLGLDVAVMRRTVEEFVRGYAQSSDDGGRALARTVVGPKLASWVHWLGVQNLQFDGTIVGVPTVSRLDFLAETHVGQTTGAQVSLSGAVSFTFDPANGQPFERTRVLDGPITLVKLGAADWGVLDLTRDGVPMTDGIQLFKKEERGAGGVSVRLDSLFMFDPNWQFNVVVTNRTDAAVPLEPSGVALLHKEAGQLERIDGALTPSLGVIHPHASVEGILAYPIQDSAEGRVLTLAYRWGRDVLPFEFPLAGLVKVVPPPAPTTPGPVVASPS